jgi:hypothetical protein
VEGKRASVCGLAFFEAATGVSGWRFYNSMRESVDIERDAYDSQGKANHRPSPRGTLSEAWKGRAGYVNGVLGSSSIKLGQNVNSAALCYLILLLLVGALSFQHHLSQTYKLQRLDRSR